MTIEYGCGGQLFVRLKNVRICRLIEIKQASGCFPCVRLYEALLMQKHLLPPASLRTPFCIDDLI